MDIIPIMNVNRQYFELKDEIDTAVIDVLSSGSYIMGDAVSVFERDFASYCGTDYSVGVGNGTDALMIALEACGIGADDEVITGAMSFIATAEAIARVGAIPVFVDCVADSFTLDIDSVISAITEKTKAILPVHLYGQCCDMNRLVKLAKENGIRVVEDCAQAAGMIYDRRKAGQFGDCGCYSFFPTKNLGCAGDGGAIVTNDEDLYKRCRALRAHGGGNDGYYAYSHNNAGLPIEEFDFGNNLPKYYNFVLGYNSRLDTIQAAILNNKLKHLDSWVEKRRKIANRYDIEINNGLVHKIHHLDGCEPAYYVYVICVDNRDDFREYMRMNNILTGVYFPVPMHLQSVFSDLGYEYGSMPNAEYLAEHGVAIPMFPELTDNEIDYVIEKINDWRV